MDAKCVLESEDGEQLFVMLEKASVEDKMVLMKSLHYVQTMVSWLKWKTCVMVLHQSRTKMERMHMRKGLVGKVCLMGWQTKGVTIRTFKRDP